MGEFVGNRQILFGENAGAGLAGILTVSQKKRAFLAVYDRNAEYVKYICSQLDGSGITYTIFDQVPGEPNLEMVDSAARLCRENKCDCVIAIGGGSVIDISKLVAMLSTNEGECEDYQLGRKTVKEDPLYFIAIPTTAGTGAEATKTAVVFNERQGWKKGIYDNSMIADCVILDPATTEHLPKKVAVFTGMDAIVHAIESAVSLNATEITRMYSLRAVKLLTENIVRVYEHPDDTDARTNMLIGSYMAGCALTAGSGLAHIVGQPLGALYHVPHGASCSIFLIPTMRVNEEYASEHFVEVAEAMGINTKDRVAHEIFEELVGSLELIMNRIDAPRRLYDYYPEDMDIEAALDNIQSCMAHIKSNPAPSERNMWKKLVEMAR